MPDVSLHHTDFVDRIDEDAAVVFDLAADGLDAPVPTCPGWTVADLVRHVAKIHWWATAAVTQADLEPVQRRDSPPPPPDDELVGWAADQTRALTTALRAAGPTSPAWTFAGAGTAGFWARRHAHELSIHRFDVELAVTGAPAPIDAALAVDGIDEYLTVFTARRGVPEGHDGRTLHVHCTDVDGEWLVRLVGDHAEVTREHAKGDVAARGSASDLIVCLWSRQPLDVLDVFGDRDLLAAFAGHVGR